MDNIVKMLLPKYLTVIFNFMLKWTCVRKGIGMFLNLLLFYIYQVTRTKLFSLSYAASGQQMLSIIDVLFICYFCKTEFG